MGPEGTNRFGALPSRRRTRGFLPQAIVPIHQKGILIIRFG